LISDEEINKILVNCPKRLLSFDHNIFERAMFEHNLFSISKVYENISFYSLEKFLKYDLDKVSKKIIFK
jgi:hypothetical protein